MSKMPKVHLGLIGMLLGVVENRRNFRQDTMMIGICEDVATEVSIIEALPFGESLP